MTDLLQNDSGKLYPLCNNLGTDCSRAEWHNKRFFTVGTRLQIYHECMANALLMHDRTDFPLHALVNQLIFSRFPTPILNQFLILCI